MAGKFDRFLIATIVFDVILLAVGGRLAPPIDPAVYGAILLFVVSPLLSYVVVYRLLD